MRYDMPHTSRVREFAMPDRLCGLKIGDRVRTASGFTPQEEGTIVDYGPFGSGVVVVDYGRKLPGRALADRLVRVS